MVMRGEAGVVEIELGMEVFRDLGHGLRIYLQSLARALLALGRLMERRGEDEYEAASSDASECRVYAESLFRRAAQLIQRPGGREPFFSLPQLYSLTHSCLICAEGLEELAGAARGGAAVRGAASLLGGLAEEVSALASLVDGPDASELISRARGLEARAGGLGGDVGDGLLLCLLRGLRRLFSELGRYALLTSHVRAER